MLSVVVPVYNEERSVELLFDEIRAALEPLEREWEVVFVDDGSTDGSFAALTRLHARAENVRVVRLRRNFGKSAALAAGFRQAEGDVIVTLDADGQDDPAEIPRLLAKLDEGFDLVSGWKTRRRDPWRRRAVSRVFNAVTGWISGVRLHDMNCGLKAYRAEVVRGLALYGELHRFLPVLAHERGFRVTELPVNHRPREHGRSRYGVERYLRGFFDLITVTFMGRYRHRPLHLFGGLGLAPRHGRLPALRLPDRALADGARDRASSAAHARRAARRRRDAVPLAGLIGEMITTHHEERTARARPRRAARRRDPLLKVLYFGTYERGYPRNAQVIASLRGAGVEVVERHEPVWEGAGEAWRAGAGAALRLARAELRLLAAPDAARSTRCSSATPATSTCAAARRNAGGAPVVFNPLVSLADTFVSDRRRFRAGSLAARALERIDRWALRAADVVVADTQANADFLAGLAGLEHVEVCFVGAEERVFRPAPTTARAHARALRRQADPAARPRDDPGRGAAAARTCASASSGAASSTRLARGPARERRVGALGRVRAAAATSCTRRASRSESSARPRRRSA